MQTSLIQLDCVDMAVKYSRNEEKIQIGWENVRLVTDWLITNWLSAPCVNSDTVNTCRKHVSVELEPETVN